MTARRPQPAPDARRFTCDHRGCSLSYRVRGEGPPVLLIQGVGVHGDGWRPQTDALAARFRCLTFDSRGMGLSQPHKGPLSVKHMTEDALALMDAQGWESAHIVGHSLGGLVAQRVSLVAPRRVRSLSLLCTFANGRDATRMTPRMAWVGLRTRLGPLRQRRDAFLEFILTPREHAAHSPDQREATAARLAPLFGHDLARQPRIAIRQLRAMRRCDLTARLHELAPIPTLVVSARFDPIAPPIRGRAIAEAVAKAAPGAPVRFVEVEDASHGVTIQRADRINSLLLEHLATSEARWNPTSQ